MYRVYGKNTDSGSSGILCRFFTGPKIVPFCPGETSDYTELNKNRR